jgi:GntR family transcriptional regulator, histidine utilization repressor
MPAPHIDSIRPSRRREDAISVDETETLPRYLEIQRDLQAKITSGEWKPGSRIPPEHALQSQYGCSRMTVNKALSAMAKAGMILRRRRSGSFVAQPRSQQTILTIHDIKAEILAKGLSYRFDCLARDRRVMTRQDAAALMIEPIGQVLAMSLVHYANDLPFVLEERLLNLAIVPDADKEPFADTPPGTWLLNRVAWTDAEHIISARLADPRAARLLAVERASACLVVERRTWQAGSTITWVRLTYPGERHCLTSHFSPSATFSGEDEKAV